MFWGFACIFQNLKLALQWVPPQPRIQLDAHVVSVFPCHCTVMNTFKLLWTILIWWYKCVIELIIVLCRWLICGVLIKILIIYVYVVCFCHVSDFSVCKRIFSFGLTLCVLLCNGGNRPHKFTTPIHGGYSSSGMCERWILCVVSWLV